MTGLNCLVVIGTRPEAVKMVPVFRTLLETPTLTRPTLVLTGQHHEIVHEVLEVFGVHAHIDLGLMQHGQTLSDFTARALTALTSLLARARPDVVLVQGDTTTVFVASLAAFYQQIPVGHVEAGLRSYDRHQPFPEEINRRLTGALADIHFAPTQSARDNLLHEQVPASHIFVTGNPVIDALLMIKDHAIAQALVQFPFLTSGKRTLLVTSHRRENHGGPLTNICTAVKQLVARYEDVQVLWSVHPNPAVTDVVHRELRSQPRVHLVPPISYCTFVGAMALAHVILTDSGGVQEEAPALGKPVLVLRDTTERPEAVQAGTAKVIGTATQTIISEAARLFDDSGSYRAMAAAVSPYGDGQAAQRIRDALCFYFGLRPHAPDPFVGVSLPHATPGVTQPAPVHHRTPAAGAAAVS